MKILCVNCYSAQSTFDEQFRKNRVKPEVSIQKYFRLFLSGLIKAGADVTTISERQISYRDTGVYYKGYEEKDEYGQRVIYTSLVTIPVLYQIWLILHALFYTPYYFLRYGKPDYVICDIMRFYSSFPTLLVGKTFGIKVIGYVADIPQMYHHQTNKRQPLYKRILKSVYSVTSIYYDAYILLSEYMNEHVNAKGKPFVVVEGIVDDSDILKQKEEKENKDVKAYMYAGGLYEKYGVKMLVDAFRTEKKDNIELWLFGKGELEGYINENADERIKFFGYQENEFVVQKQREASFLINPRPTNEDFTKYSFPSKIMEYMVSGTPVISTKIKSIPAGYWDYIIPIETESIEGIKEVLNKTSKLSEFECERIGRLSRDFVLKNKNGLTQGNKVIQWLQDSFK